MTDSSGRYRPIRDYAVIGDAHTAALVASDGSIDWCCFPHFDSPAAFCKILDAEKGGSFRVGPAGRYTASREYADATNVLVTTFEAETGVLRVTDFMPVEQRSVDRRGEDILTRHDVLRLVEVVEGEVDVEVSFRPTFDFARAETSVEPVSGGAIARAPNEALALECPIPLAPAAGGGVAGTARLRAPDRIWLHLHYEPGSPVEAPDCAALEHERALADTAGYWRKWAAACTYDGPYRDLVRRSALTLKLLTFEPTGAIVAAPTTSLPEAIGGVRNWDYRYSWLRDASLILDAFVTIGYYEEALDFFDWLDDLCSGRPMHYQIMYSVTGGANLREETLDHLEGYRGSRPVRVGNAASRQVQLDVYGEVIDAAHFSFERAARPIGPDLAEVLTFMADQAAARWREPDQGIWEVRGAPRHYLYSKLLCWVALDRALDLAEKAGLRGDVGRWRSERAAIRAAILEHGYDERVGAFTQAFGESALDASALAVPRVGFLPATDPRVRSTADRIREHLTANGLVYRYLNDDGLPGGEATFALCSFWLVDNLALGGRVDEARELFERLASYGSDLGLFAEMIDPDGGELLGNFPQGFTHLGLIRSAFCIAKAERWGSEDRTVTEAERSRWVEDAGRAPAK